MFLKIFMPLTNKRRNKPLYKKFLTLRKNIQNNDKFLKFRKKKWQKFQHLTLKFNRKRFYDPISHVLFNFKDFFSRKFKYNLQNKQRLSFFYGRLRKSYLKKLVRSSLKGKVELVVILSGHGQAGQTNCSEWCDHRHQFAVNGNDLDEIRHQGNVGSTAGCGPAAAQGVPPGQFGNWAPERAYWCPGLPVEHMRIDITDRVNLGQANQMSYSANYRGGAPGGGNIDLSAYVVWSE